MSADPTALSYWFPKLLAAGLPVPRTTVVAMPVEAQESIWAAFDGEDRGDARPFFKQIEAAAEAFGFPCFLRTDHTSAKHSWRNTCFLLDAASIPQHVFRIAEFSELAGFPCGLPWNMWAVREMLPTIPHGVCRRYGDMPVCREFRCFVEGERVDCVHPYWPQSALADGALDAAGFDYDKFVDLAYADHVEIVKLASAAGKAVGGAWSVDILETAKGWFITDMAEAHKSFHWEGCAQR